MLAAGAVARLAVFLASLDMNDDCVDDCARTGSSCMEHGVWRQVHLVRMPRACVRLPTPYHLYLVITLCWISEFEDATKRMHVDGCLSMSLLPGIVLGVW